MRAVRRAPPLAAFAALTLALLLSDTRVRPASASQKYEVFPTQMTVTLFKPTVPQYILSVMVLSNDGSNDVEWSVDEYPSFNVEAVGSQSGTLTPGGRTTLEVRANATDVAGGKYLRQMRLANGLGQIRTVNIAFFVDADPDALMSTASSRAAVAKAGGEITVEVLGYDSDGLASNTNTVTISCRVTVDGQTVNVYLSNTGGNKFSESQIINKAGAFEFACRVGTTFLPDAQKFTVTVLPADVSAQHSLARMDGAICNQASVCGAVVAGEEFTLGLDLYDEYGNVFEPADGVASVFYRNVHTGANLASIADGDGTPAATKVDYTDHRNGTASGVVSVEQAGRWAAVPHIFGSEVTTFLVEVSAASLASVSLYVEGVDEDSPRTLSQGIVESGPSATPRCDSSPCTTVLSGQRALAWVFLFDEYGNSVTPGDNGETALFRVYDLDTDAELTPVTAMEVQGQADSPSPGGDLGDSPSSGDGGGSGRGARRRLLQNSASAFYGFNALNVTAISSDKAQAIVQLWVAPGINASEDKATYSKGGFFLRPGSLSLADGDASLAIAGETYACESDALDLGAPCANATAGDAVKVTMTAVDAHGNLLTDPPHGNVRALVMQKVDTSDDSVAQGVSMQFRDGVFSASLPTAAFQAARDYRLRVLHAQPRAASVSVDVLLKAVAGAAWPQSTQLARSDALGGSLVPCNGNRNGATCGDEATAGEPFYWVVTLRDSYQNRLPSLGQASVAATVRAAGVGAGRPGEEASYTLGIMDYRDGSLRLNGTLTAAAEYQLETKVGGKVAPPASGWHVTVQAAALAIANATFQLGTCEDDPNRGPNVPGCVPRSHEFAQCASGALCATVTAGAQLVFLLQPLDAYLNPLVGAGPCEMNVSALAYDAWAADSLGALGGVVPGGVLADFGGVGFDAGAGAYKAQFSVGKFRESVYRVEASIADEYFPSSIAFIMTAAEADHAESFVSYFDLALDRSVPCNQSEVCVDTTAGERIELDIETRDRFGNTRYESSSLDVTYRIGDSIPQPAIYGGRGVYKFAVSSLVTREATTHSVTVGIQGQALSTAPLLIDVAPATARASETTVMRLDADMDALSCQTGVTCGKSLVAGTAALLVATARDEYSNGLESSAGPLELRSEEVDTLFTDGNNGTYHVAVNLTLAAVQVMTVKLGGLEVQSSRFVIDVIPAALDAAVSQLDAALVGSDNTLSASVCTVDAPCVEVEAGELVRFTVHPLDVFGNAVNSSAAGACAYTLEENTPVEVDADMTTGTFVFEAVVDIVPAFGVAALEVSLGPAARLVGNGIFAFAVEPAEADAQRTTVSRVIGAGRSACAGGTTACASVTAGSALTFEVLTCDKYGNVRASSSALPVRFALHGGSSSTANDGGFGAYTISASAAELQVAGRHELAVTLGDEPFAFSPIRIDVSPAVADPAETWATRVGSAAQCAAGTACGADVVAGEVVRFRVGASDEYSNALATGGSALELRAAGGAFGLADQGNGTYSGSFVLRGTGIEEVRALLGGVDIANSRFTLNVLPAALDPAASTLEANLDGSQPIACEAGSDVACITALAGQSVFLTVTPLDRFQNLVADAGACQFSVGAEPRQSAVRDDTGRVFAFSATITQVPASGRVPVRAWLSGGAVGGGNHSIAVEPAEADAQRTTVSLTQASGSVLCRKGKAPCATVSAGTALAFFVETSDEFNNRRDSSSALPVQYSFGGASLAFANDNGVGTYGIALPASALETSAEYSLVVRLGGIELKSSPVTIAVAPGLAAPSQIFIAREGVQCTSLEPCGGALVAGKRLRLSTMAKDAYGNRLVSSGGVVEVRVGDGTIALEDADDGTYAAKIPLTLAGEHAVVATLGGVEVANSRFFVQVVSASLNAATSDLLLSVDGAVAFACPHRESGAQDTAVHCARVSAGARLDFSIDALDAFGNAADAQGVACNTSWAFVALPGAAVLTAVRELSTCAGAPPTFQLVVPKAGELSLNVSLGGAHVGNASFVINVQPSDFNASFVDIVRVGARGGDEMCASHAQCGAVVPPGNAIDLEVILRDGWGNKLTLAQVGDHSVLLKSNLTSGAALTSTVTDISRGEFNVEVVSQLKGSVELTVLVDGTPAATKPILKWYTAPAAVYGELTLDVPEEADLESEETKQALAQTLADSLGVPVEWIIIDSLGDGGGGAETSRRSLLSGVVAVNYRIFSPDHADSESVLMAAEQVEALTPETVVRSEELVELGVEVASTEFLGADDEPAPLLSAEQSLLSARPAGGTGVGEECRDGAPCGTNGTAVVAGSQLRYEALLVDEFLNVMGYAPANLGCAVRVADQLGVDVTDEVNADPSDPLVLGNNGTCALSITPVLSGRYYARTYLGSIAQENAVSGMNLGVLLEVVAAGATSPARTKWAFVAGRSVVAGEPFALAIVARDEFGNVRLDSADSFRATALPEDPDSVAAQAGGVMVAQVTSQGDGAYLATFGNTSTAGPFCANVTLGDTLFLIELDAADASEGVCFTVEPAPLSPSRTMVAHVVEAGTVREALVPGLPPDIIAGVEYTLQVQVHDRFGNVRATGLDVFKVRAADADGEAVPDILYESNTQFGVTKHFVTLLVPQEQASRMALNITAENFAPGATSVHIKESPLRFLAGCPAGFLPNNYHGKLPGCVDCDPEALVCHGGADAQFTVPSGRFLPRVAATCDSGECLLARSYECISDDACESNASDRLVANWTDLSTQSLCAAGYEAGVVLCDSCLPGWVANDAGTGCEQCPESMAASYTRFVGICVAMLIIVILLFLLIRRSMKRSEVSARQMLARALAFMHENAEFLRDDFADAASSAKAVVQIILQNAQVLGQVWQKLSDKMAPAFTNIFGPLLVLDLNPFNIIKLGCLSTTASQGYWDVLIFKAAIPFVISFVSLAMGFRSVRSILGGKLREADLENARSTAASAMVFGLFLLNLLHPSISSTMFETFNCRQYDLDKTDESEYWLRLDHSVRCYDKQWWSYAILSALLIVLYVFGYPLLLLAGLRFLQGRRLVVAVDDAGVPIPHARPFYTSSVRQVIPDLDKATCAGEASEPPPEPQHNVSDSARLYSVDSRRPTMDGAGLGDAVTAAAEEVEDRVHYYAQNPYHPEYVPTRVESVLEKVRRALVGEGNAVKLEDAPGGSGEVKVNASSGSVHWAGAQQREIRVELQFRSAEANLGSVYMAALTQLNHDETFERFVRPFVDPFEERYYFWQCYEIARRLTQTSFIVIVDIINPDYVVTYATFVAITSLVVQAYFQPYRADAADNLELVFCINLYIVLFGTLLQENIGDAWEGSWQEKAILTSTSLLGIYIAYALYGIMKDWISLLFGIAKAGVKSLIFGKRRRRDSSESTGGEKAPDNNRASETSDANTMSGGPSDVEATRAPDAAATDSDNDSSFTSVVLAKEDQFV